MPVWVWWWWWWRPPPSSFRLCACQPSSCWSSRMVWGIIPTPWTTCSDWPPGEFAGSQICRGLIPECPLTSTVCLSVQVCPEESCHFAQQQHHRPHHPVRHRCHLTGPPRRQLQRHEVCPRPHPHRSRQRCELTQIKRFNLNWNLNRYQKHVCPLCSRNITHRSLCCQCSAENKVKKSCNCAGAVFF